VSPAARAAGVDAALVLLALLDAAFSAGREGGAALALSVLAALGLVVRRRWPYLAFGLSLPALAVAYVLIAPIVALYTVAATVRTRPPLVLCALLYGAAYYLPWPPTTFSWHGGPRDLLGLIYTGVFVAMPVSLGLLARTRRELAASLSEVRAGQAREQRLLTERVLQEERSRLAREMHDVVSHQVSLIAVRAGALEVTAKDDGVRQGARTIRELSARTLGELRHMVGVLRRGDPEPADLFPQPRLTDVPRLVEESGQDVTLDVDGVLGRGWSEPVERAAYRTVQEGLTNVAKHAPGARVRVEMATHARGLRIRVHNGPCPTPPAVETGVTGRHGLAGLRERAELLGGRLTAGPTHDGGFALEAVFPNA
jgi:signal transduction histidine kinase